MDDKSPLDLDSFMINQKNGYENDGECEHCRQNIVDKIFPKLIENKQEEKQIEFNKYNQDINNQYCMQVNDKKPILNKEEDQFDLNNYDSSNSDINIDDLNNNAGEEININAITIDKQINSMNNLEEINSHSQNILNDIDNDKHLSENANANSSELNENTVEIAEATNVQEDANKLIDFLLPDLENKNDLPKIGEILKNTQMEKPIDEMEVIEMEKQLEKQIENEEELEKELDQIKENQLNIEEKSQTSKRSMKECQDILNDLTINSNLKESNLNILLDKETSEKNQEKVVDIQSLVSDRLKEHGISLEFSKSLTSTPEISHSKTKSNKKKNNLSLISSKRSRDHNILIDENSPKAKKLKEDISNIKTSIENIDKDKDSRKLQRETKLSVKELEPVIIIKKNKKNSEDSLKKLKKLPEKLEINKSKINKRLKSNIELLDDEDSLEDDSMVKTRRAKSEASKKESEDIKNLTIPNKKKAIRTLKIATSENIQVDSKLIKSLKKINCEIVDEENYDILLCDKLSLRIKILLAINNRKPILTMDWLKDSNSNNKIMPYDKYFLKDKEVEKRYSFNLNKTLTETPFADYLDGYSFYVTDHVSPPHDDIVELIESAAGIFFSELPKSSKKNQDLIIIADKQHDREEIKKFKLNKFTKIYNVNLILESVYTQKLDLNKNKYKI